MRLVIENLEQTDAIGKLIGTIVKEGTVICLEGDLGAGKTTLTQSIAKGMDVDDYVTSPTFTVIKEYEGRLNLYHMDAYRLDSEDDMFDLGYEEYIESKGVCVIEWASKIEGIIPKHAIKMTLNQDYNTGMRELEIVGEGENYEIITKGLEKYDNIRN